MALNVLTSHDYQEKEMCKTLIAGFYELVANRREFLDAKKYIDHQSNKMQTTRPMINKRSRIIA
jgi:hypothetical protein